MTRTTTQAIVLSRTNFGEADRIITFLTPDHGKMRGMVRGVRKQKSKLAGGIELFSVSDVTFLAGRGEINTVISTRLLKHYGQIVKDLPRTNAAYDFIKTLHRATEDNPEPGYFNLLNDSFAALDDHAINLDLAKAWFAAQLLKLAGHSPNLQTDHDGHKLEPGKTYSFNFDTMTFQTSRAGQDNFNASKIKFLRLIFSNTPLKTLQKIEGLEQLATQIQPLVRTMLQAHVRT